MDNLSNIFEEDDEIIIDDKEQKWIDFFGKNYSEVLLEAGWIGKERKALNLDRFFYNNRGVKPHIVCFLEPSTQLQDVEGTTRLGVRKEFHVFTQQVIV